MDFKVVSLGALDVGDTFITAECPMEGGNGIYTVWRKTKHNKATSCSWCENLFVGPGMALPNHTGVIRVVFFAHRS